jgi:prepilin-type N-terminal cleavage/methylation domain-containing protein
MSIRKGFTIVELLIVVIIIGVLAAIAIPRFIDSKRRAYEATMKSDLRNMVPSAESRFADDGTYANYVVPKASSGITLTFNGTADSWHATAQHAALPGVVCSIERDPSLGAVSEPVCN